MPSIKTRIASLPLDDAAFFELAAYCPDKEVIEQIKKLVDMKRSLEANGVRVKMTVFNLHYKHTLRMPEGFKVIDHAFYETLQFVKPPRCSKCRAVAVFERRLPNPNPATTAMEYQCFHGHRWTVEKLWD